MKKVLLAVLIIFSCYHFATAQKASDVLENGIHVKSDYALFLKFDEKDKVLKYAISKSKDDVANPIKPIPLSDSTIFLVTQTALPTYLLPLNPLNFSQTTENKITIDQINEAATAALGSIIDVLRTSITTPLAAEATDSKATRAKPPAKKCDTLFKYLESQIKLIQNTLNDNKKSNIIAVFNRLKALPFTDETKTIDSLKGIKLSIADIEKHFKNMESLIVKTKYAVNSYDCGSPETNFTYKFVFNSILKEFSDARREQIKRLENLQSACNLVEKAQKDASTGGDEKGLKWCIKLDEIPSTRGKISNFSTIIKESGYNLSANNEIVSTESKDLLKRTIRVRRFQSFVTEVSIGTAFTFFKYNSYGTKSDSTGQQFVGSPTENLVHNLNITTMMNFNYFIPNSSIHPLYQIGVGFNSGIPTILTGIGLRTNISSISSSNINNNRRLAISGGIAMTWIKELDKLKVDDKISGTDDIDKDLKFQFVWPPKLYIGLQYNF